MSRVSETTVPDVPTHVVPSTKTPRLFSRLIFGVFAWIIVGICFIYGVRMWFNSPLHPIFVPITGAAFCAALSFTLVLALEYATVPIKIKFSNVDFEGASGPIILWCLCFFVISFGLYMLGLATTLSMTVSPDPRSIIQLMQPE
jgi:hypothetical protein